MPILTVKDAKAATLSGLATAIAADSPSANAVRAARTVLDINPQTGVNNYLHLTIEGGSNLASSKSADVQRILAEGNHDFDMGIAFTQAIDDLVNTKLKNAIAKTVTADTTVAGTISGAPSGTFAAGDVGRLVQVGSEKRTIATFVSATEVTYSGAALPSSATSTVKLLGAERIQNDTLHIQAIRDNTNRAKILISMYVEGQTT